MSFYIGLLVAVPGEEELRVDLKGNNAGSVRRIVWRIDEVIDLCTIKIWPKDEGFRSLDNKRRAQVYLLDKLWPHLSQHIESGEMELAQRFVIYEDDFQKYPDRWPTELIMPISGRVRRKPMPSTEAMEAHNQALQRGERPRSLADLRDADSPIIWVDCAKISQMVERSTGHASLSDPQALAYLNVWETAFREFGKIGGKTILLVHMHASSSFW